MFFLRPDVTWILEEELAVGSLPRGLWLLEEWWKMGLRAVLVLVEISELDEVGWGSSYFKKMEEVGFKYKHSPIKDFHVPTFKQALESVKWISKMVSEGNPVLIHCNAGLGRSGVIASCYLIYQHRYNPTKAIEYIRSKRPGSLETYWQVKFVYDFTEKIRSFSRFNGSQAP